MPKAPIAARARTGRPSERSQIESMNYFLASWIALSILPAAAQTAPSSPLPNPASAKGPLRAHPENPRCLTDGTKRPDGSLKAVCLTGSHYWSKLRDCAKHGKPLTERFEFDSYLGPLARFKHSDVRRIVFLLEPLGKGGFSGRLPSAPWLPSWAMLCFYQWMVARDSGRVLLLGRATGRNRSACP